MTALYFGSTVFKNHYTNERRIIHFCEWGVEEEIKREAVNNAPDAMPIIREKGWALEHIYIYRAGQKTIDAVRAASKDN